MRSNIKGSESVVIHDQELVLLPQKALYWAEKRLLVISDLHLGKINHFRKAGIPVPSAANKKNIELLIHLLQESLPERLVFLGDLFHSSYNQEWEVFGQVLEHFPEIYFELVKGNHDILSEHQYLKHDLRIHDLQLVIPPFIFTHEPLEEIPEKYYSIAGHIHPGVNIKGKGRQRLRLPCFWFGKQQALLPAFGEFTGLHMITPTEDDAVFLIVEGKVIKK